MRSRSESQARAQQAFELSVSGLGWDEIARRLGYGNRGNAWKAAQRYVDKLPDQGNTTRRRQLSHLRLDEVWKLAWSKAATGDVPAMRVLVEIERRRALLDGMDKPTVLQIEGGTESSQQQGPTLREILPPDVVADVRTVRAQALALHRVLPAAVSDEQAS